MNKEAKIKRLAEIQDEIAKLAREGMSISDEVGVNFDLSSAPFTANYGSGGLEYYSKHPEAEDNYGEPVSEMTNSWGDEVAGEWMSSNSWGC